MTTNDTETEGRVGLDISSAGIGNAAVASRETSSQDGDVTTESRMRGAAGVYVDPSGVSGQVSGTYVRESENSETNRSTNVEAGARYNTRDGASVGGQAGVAYNNPDPEVGSVNTWDVTGSTRLDSGGLTAAVRGEGTYGLSEGTQGTLTSIFVEGAVGHNTERRETGVSVGVGVQRDVEMGPVNGQVRVGVHHNTTGTDFTDNQFNNGVEAGLSSGDGAGTSVRAELRLGF